MAFLNLIAYFVIIDATQVEFQVDGVLNSINFYGPGTYRSICVTRRRASTKYIFSFPDPIRCIASRLLHQYPLPSKEVLKGGREKERKEVRFDSGRSKQVVFSEKIPYG